jgi:hypothetical protein
VLKCDIKELINERARDSLRIVFDETAAEMNISHANKQ